MDYLARFGPLPLMLIALLLSVGCGAEADSERNPPAGPAAPAGDAARPTIGVLLPTTTPGWHEGVRWWAEQTAAAYDGIDWQIKHADAAGEQVAQLQAMREQGVDALVLLPIDAAAPVDATRLARSDGVYVVSVERGLRQPVADLHIAVDNAAFGRISAEFIVEQLAFQGKVVLLRGVPGEAENERFDAAMSVFNVHPGIEVLDAQPGNDDQDTARQVMQNWLAEHEQIDAVWSPDGAMARGVEQALREAGRAEEMWVLSGAGMNEIVARVMNEDPLYRADVTYPPAVVAAGMHLAAAEVLHDGHEQAVADRLPNHLGIDPLDLLGSTEPRSGDQRRLTLPAVLVTPENAKAYHFPDSAY